MVFKAAKAGATHAKIQTFFAEDLNPEWGEVEYKRLKNLELDWEGHEKFVRWCKDADITPMTSVYTTQYLGRLKELGFHWIKIGSAQARDVALMLDYSCEFNMVVSTGGHALGELSFPEKTYGVLHCVSKYPTTPFEANLSRMLTIKEKWPQHKVGFSSHIDPGSMNWDQPLKAALTMGADILEVHFNILGPKAKDDSVSLDEQQLKEIGKFHSFGIGEQLREMPQLGMFWCNQDPVEYAVIDKYKSRWKKR